MKPTFKTHTSLLTILSILTFSYLIYILYQVNTNVAEALNIDQSHFTPRDYIIGVGYLCILIFHVYAIIYIFAHFHRIHALNVLKIVIIILSVMSLFGLGVQKVLIDEIAREYRLGWDLSEVALLNGTYIINMAFTMLMFFLLLRTFRLIEGENSLQTSVDETIFTIAQCMGILSGIMGVWFTFNLIEKSVSGNILWAYVPFYLLFVVPYALAVLYWLSLKRKQHISDWYDEKQLQDILKSSLTTLLLSIPGLAIFLLIKIPSHFYILPYYIFFVLLIFSSSTLYFFKIKDIG